MNNIARVLGRFQSEWESAPPPQPMQLVRVQARAQAVLLPESAKWAMIHTIVAVREVRGGFCISQQSILNLNICKVGCDNPCTSEKSEKQRKGWEVVVPASVRQTTWATGFPDRVQPGCHWAAVTQSKQHIHTHMHS